MYHDLIKTTVSSEGIHNRDLPRQKERAVNTYPPESLVKKIGSRI